MFDCRLGPGIILAIVSATTILLVLALALSVSTTFALESRTKPQNVHCSSS